MDYILALWMSALIRLSGRSSTPTGCGPWKPGDKLRLLLAGYNGARNTGSDVRVEEISRQFRTILGEQNIELTVLTRDPALSEGYFQGAAQRTWPDLFPPFLYREVPRYHGVVACEGSMFKSKFANALTTLMIGSLGLAVARGLVAVGYGGEADHMVAYLRRMCA